MKKKTLAIASASAIAVTTFGFGGFASAMDKDITLTVDGNSKAVSVWGTTVSDALKKHNIKIGEHDQVIPSADSKISDGTMVDVKFGRLVKITIDGVTKEIWTTATTVDELLNQLGLRGTDHEISVSRSTPIGREGLTLTATLRILVDIMSAIGNGAEWGAAADRVRHGGKLSEALAATSILPAMATRMIRIGEETGQVPVLAGRIAEFYEAKLQRSLDRIVGIVGPAAIILISTVVGGLIVSVMSALLSVTQLVG